MIGTLSLTPWGVLELRHDSPLPVEVADALKAIPGRRSAPGGYSWGWWSEVADRIAALGAFQIDEAIGSVRSLASSARERHQMTYTTSPPDWLTWKAATTPYPHQWAFKWWRRGGGLDRQLHPKCLLEAGLGTGKTLTGIDEALEVVRHKPRAQILVLARHSNLQTVWGEQIPQHAKGLIDWCILDGTRKERAELLERIGRGAPTIWVHSHEDLPAMGELLASLDWDMILVDESSRFRTAGAGRVARLTGAYGRRTLDADVKIAMTGMPVIKQATNLYPTLRWLGAPTGTKAEFQERWVVVDGYGRELALKDPEGLNGLIDTVRFSIPKQSVLSVPRTFHYERVPLTTKQRATYKRIQKELKTRFVSPEGEIAEAEIETHLSELLRLAQVTAGIEAIDAERWNWDERNAKTRHLLEVILPELTNEKIIVWGVFRPEVESLRRLIAKTGRQAVSFYGSGATRDPENQRSYDLWKEGKADVFVSTLAKGSHGLNLPEASTMIFHSRDFNTENWVQGLDRNYRLTTTHANLHVVVLEAEGTIDQKVTKVLGDDIRKASQLTSADVRDMLGL